MRHTLIIPFLVLAGCSVADPPENAPVDDIEEIPCTFIKGLPSELNEAPLLAEIVTPEDFNALALSSPLASLSPESYQRFADSLTFGDRGVSSLRYVELEDELSPEEIAKLFVMLGARRDDDTIRDYHCAGRATCRSEMGSYCITANC